MTTTLNDISSSDMQDATGVTRDELIQWHRNGILKIAPFDPSPGRARRYGLANLIETTLLKTCVSKGIPHDVAVDMIIRRLGMAVAKKWAGNGDYKEFTESFYNDPRAVLEGTEFDPIAPPFMSEEEERMLDGRVYWTFCPKGRNIVSESLIDRYDNVVMYAPMWKREREKRNAPQGYGPSEDPIHTVTQCVLGAINDGCTVVEIRGPIRKALAYVYSSHFWPGRLTQQ